MYLNHFGLDEPPFRITPHTDFFFSGANRGATLEALLYAITHDEGIVKVSGEVGSGKTMLCRVLMERLPAHVDTILLSNPSLAREEMLYAIADELKLEAGIERQPLLLRILQDHLIKLYGEGRRVVVLIDEAHAMPQETLEQIRLLSNLESSRSKLLQIVLFGQPELDTHLSMPHMRQLKERITHSFRLDPLLRSDIEAYLDFRMRAAGYRGPNVFSAEAVRRIVKASEGLTRRVNILADKSLLAAFADNEHGITAKHVDRAIRDSEFYNAPLSRAKIGLAAGGVAAGLGLGLGLHYLLLPPTPAPLAAPALAATMSAPGAQAATSASSASASDPPSAAPVQAGVMPAAVAANATTPVRRDLAQANSVTPVAVTTVTPGPSVSTTAPARQQSIRVASSTQSTTAPAATAQTASIAQTAAVNTAPAAGVAPAPAAAAESQVATGAKPGSKNYAPPAPPTGKLTRERFAATQDWLKNAPGDQYSIQLLTTGGHDVRRIEDVLARAETRNLKLSDMYIYGVKINDQQHYRLAYGLYPTQDEVRDGIKNMPSVYRKFGLYYRSVERMRSQNRQ